MTVPAAAPSSRPSPSLAEPGAVLLVSCYELGHQPLGLASPLGFLARAGYGAAAAIDLAVDTLDAAQVERARFVGFSVPMHTATRIAVKAAARIRAQNPAAHICFFGLYAPLARDLIAATHNPDEALADSILGGEYEQALVDLVVSLDRAGAMGEEPDGEATDVARGTRGGRAAPLTVLSRLRFAPPARAALPPLDRYAHLVRADGRHAVAGYTEASRGCLHSCRHCPLPAVYDGRFFVVPVDVVLEDVRRQVEAGAEHVTLGDPDFLNGPRHAMAVVHALHDAFPRLTFDITAKIEHLLHHRALLPELRAAGCLFVTSAVESLSERVLAILDKGHTRADVEEAIRLMREVGLALRPTWLPFTPWSTLDEHCELFECIEAWELLGCVDPVQLTLRLLLPPGSLLAAHPAMQPHLGAFDPASLSFNWLHPDHKMDQLQRASSERVHRGEAAREPAEITYAALRALAFEAAGRTPSEARPRFPTEGAPKLSESWFC